jgi:CubicO group peptidase (beta-lactamase class C family)
MRLTLMLLLCSIGVAAAQPAKIDTVMKPWSGPKTPGCAVAVTEKGKVTFSKGYGMADLERNVAITPATVFDIGSVSKQLTAAIIHLLAAQKTLDLDDDIRKHLPELPALTKTPVTIRHLLHHTGGLRDYTALLVLGGRQIADIATSRETVRVMARQKGVEFEPGTRFSYSNTGYFLLAQIAERAGKRTMAELVRDQIYKPLGMTASHVFDDHEKLFPGRALSYAPTEGGWKISLSQWQQTGDGSVLTTVGDLAKWDANFSTPKLGGTAFVETMQKKGRLANGTELDYASGLFHATHRGQPVIQHSGGWSGYRAQLMRFPALGSVIVMCNAANANPVALSHQIADAMWGKRLGPADTKKPAAEAAVTLTDPELDAWAGSYRELASGTVAVIKRDKHTLIAEAGQPFPLVPIDKSTFRLGPTPFKISFAGTKPKRTATLAMGGSEPDQKFVEVSFYKTSAAELAAVAGRYYSPELGVVWTIRLEGGAAVIDGPNLDAAPLSFTTATDAASAPVDIAISLAKGPKGITGFAMTSGSLRGLRFDRI